VTRVPSWSADVAAVTTAAVFGVLVWWMFHAVSQAGNLGREVRDAENTRSSVLRSQLDEETGLRGYAGTGRQVFLQPYRIAQRDFATSIEEQLRALQLLDGSVPPAAVVAANAEALINERWEREIAAPLIAAPRRRDAAALQLRGKQLIDGFREQTATIVASLLGAASAADLALQTALRQIVLFGVIGALVLIFAVRWLTQTADRLRGDAYRQRLLYEDEKRIADQLQKAFLQRTLPDVASVEMHAVYMPAEQQAQVGGDWYDAMRLPDGRLFVSVGDVSGHGVDAAVTMSRARQALITLATLSSTPGQILERVNRTLVLQGQSMVTAICCFIDPETFAIDYARAGHPPPIVVEAGAEPEFVGGQGVPLGIVPDAQYQSFSLSPKPGALLVLYTDGLVEYDRDLVGGERRLLRAAGRVAAADPADPAAALRDTIFSKTGPVDDVAILTLRIRGRGKTARRWIGRKAEGRRHSGPMLRIVGL
jgi:CHASE3 domain sensor protein